MRSNDAPRILITRLSAIGDCVHTMPLVSALRERLPNAMIGWAVQSAGASLLDGYPGLDELIVVRRDWMKSLSSIVEVRRRLRSLRFDVAIDPQSLTKSALLGWLSGARLRIGFDKPQGRELSLVLNNQRIAPKHDHVVDRYLELLEPVLGTSLPEVRFEMPERTAPKLDQLIETVGGKNQFVVLNPGAGWQSKTWVPERFGEVARHLLTTHKLRSIAVWAGDEEQAWAKQIVATSGGAAELAPETSLPELGELLRAAKFCVAGDTGPLHLAVAVNTPCVGMYGSTKPEICGPYGAEHEVVQAYYQDGSCRNRRSAPNNAMAAITAEMVVHACDRLISRHSRSGEKSAA